MNQAERQNQQQNEIERMDFQKFDVFRNLSETGENEVINDLKLKLTSLFPNAQNVKMIPTRSGLMIFDPKWNNAIFGSPKQMQSRFSEIVVCGIECADGSTKIPKNNDDVAAIVKDERKALKSGLTQLKISSNSNRAMLIPYDKPLSEIIINAMLDQFNQVANIVKPKIININETSTVTLPKFTFNRFDAQLNLLNIGLDNISRLIQSLLTIDMFSFVDLPPYAFQMSEFSRLQGSTLAGMTMLNFDDSNEIKLVWNGLRQNARSMMINTPADYLTVINLSDIQCYSLDMKLINISTTHVIRQIQSYRSRVRINGFGELPFIMYNPSNRVKSNDTVMNIVEQLSSSSLSSTPVNSICLSFEETDTYFENNAPKQVTINEQVKSQCLTDALPKRRTIPRVENLPTITQPTPITSQSSNALKPAAQVITNGDLDDDENDDLFGA